HSLTGCRRGDPDFSCQGGFAAFLLLGGLALGLGGLRLGHRRISSLWVAVAGAPPVAVPAAGSDSYLSSREDIQAIPAVFTGFFSFPGISAVSWPEADAARQC